MTHFHRFLFLIFSALMGVFNTYASSSSEWLEAPDRRYVSSITLEALTKARLNKETKLDLRGTLKDLDNKEKCKEIVRLINALETQDEQNSWDITEIDLSNNQLDRLCTQFLAEFIQNNETIIPLNFSNNDITDEAIEALKQAL